MCSSQHTSGPFLGLTTHLPTQGPPLPWQIPQRMGRTCHLCFLPTHFLLSLHIRQCPHALLCSRMVLLKVTKALSKAKSKGFFFSPIFYTEFDIVDILFVILPFGFLKQDTLLVHTYFLALSPPQSLCPYFLPFVPPAEHFPHSICLLLLYNLSYSISPVSDYSFNYYISLGCVKSTSSALDPHFRRPLELCTCMSWIPSPQYGFPSRSSPPPPYFPVSVNRPSVH